MGGESAPESGKQQVAMNSGEPTGTFVHKSNASWLREQLKDITPIDIYCWRSVSTKFTRTYIREKADGKLFLRFIFRLEELFPHYFGENGQYPIVAIKKTTKDTHVPPGTDRQDGVRTVQAK